MYTCGRGVPVDYAEAKLETEDSGRAVDAVRAVAERAVALAPPTPAAVRRNFKFPEDIDFN